ncbi:uncharacterized protein AMSG_09284 [Thecamonas trahens ATCC 50062]|uniref:Tubulin polyglutamylase TTLL4 n=1 Tax=Thecamonas trahens ATCC 50062 TaxID=461836 RepID=A0A0L0DLS4_THETB|nr:hypothetical protein AMSG_09284 [Thecamonas trahens ATCC 50062]KNC53200.1 hypothetical protein AMSG_09284 [Thecamonas trahens ATCC 50062]|eukprot:XP_013754670.1 hypothetical protein AMSG_09284 [Thecamonas trahens ATCC 50062]
MAAQSEVDDTEPRWGLGSESESGTESSHSGCDGGAGTGSGRRSCGESEEAQAKHAATGTVGQQGGRRVLHSLEETPAPREAMLTTALPAVNMPGLPVALLTFEHEGEGASGGEDDAAAVGAAERAGMPKRLRRSMVFLATRKTPHVVKRAMMRAGVQVVKRTSRAWLGTWGPRRKDGIHRKVSQFTRINHLPGSSAIGRKDRLYLTLRRMASAHPGGDYAFFPLTYLLPQGEASLRRKMRTLKGGTPWIVKPRASARGNGIQVISRASEVPSGKSCIVQRYIKSPLLINGTKFDIRLYVAVMSVNPLTVYLFDDGLVRFATVKYAPGADSWSNRFMHLTNYSVNKHNTEYKAAGAEAGSESGSESDGGSDESQAHKWSLAALKQYFAEHGIGGDEVWERVDDLVVKTIIAMESEVAGVVRAETRHRSTCYELFGFDVFLDSKLKPWLIEVNISPSLHTSTALDRRIKDAMVCDLFNLAGFTAYDVGQHGRAERRSVASRLVRPTSAGMAVGRGKAARGKGRRRERRSAERDEWGLGALSAADVRVLREFELQISRRGRFRLLFPRPSTFERYVGYFLSSFRTNHLVWALIKSGAGSVDEFIGIGAKPGAGSGTGAAGAAGAAVEVVEADEVDGVEVEVDGVEVEADGIEVEADGVEVEVDGVEVEADGVEVEADGVEVEVDGVEVEADGVEVEVDGVEVEADGEAEIEPKAEPEAEPEAQPQPQPQPQPEPVAADGRKVHNVIVVEPEELERMASVPLTWGAVASKLGHAPKREVRYGPLGGSSGRSASAGPRRAGLVMRMPQSAGRADRRRGLVSARSTSSLPRYKVAGGDGGDGGDDNGIDGLRITGARVRRRVGP